MTRRNKLLFVIFVLVTNSFPPYFVDGQNSHSTEDRNSSGSSNRTLPRVAAWEIDKDFRWRHHLDQIPQPGKPCTFDGKSKSDPIGYEMAYMADLKEVLKIQGAQKRENDGTDPLIGALTQKWCMDPFLYCDESSQVCKCAEISTEIYFQDCAGLGVGENESVYKIQLEEEFDGVQMKCVRPDGSICGMRENVYGNCKATSVCGPKYFHGRTQSFCGQCVPLTKFEQTEENTEKATEDTNFGNVLLPSSVLIPLQINCMLKLGFL